MKLIVNVVATPELSLPCDLKMSSFGINYPSLRSLPLQTRTLHSQWGFQEGPKYKQITNKTNLLAKVPMGIAL